MSTCVHIHMCVLKIQESDKHALIVAKTHKLVYSKLNVQWENHHALKGIGCSEYF